MATYSDEDRIFKVDTPLGADVLLIRSFRAESEVSHPFHLTLDLISTREDIDPAQLLREPIALHIGLSDGGEGRVIHGVVNRFRQLGRVEDLTSYQAEIVPWLWFLTLSADCKIFQKLAVPAIIAEVFDELGYPDYEFRLTRSYVEREFCVQYRETHFNFVSRLLEEEGLFYFFEHSDDRHLLVISDDNSAFEPTPGQSVAYMAPAAGGGEGEDVITELLAEHAVQSGQASLDDFDFLKPKGSLRATRGDGEEELYDYPGGYHVRTDGETYAQQIVDEHQARTHRVTGTSTVRSIQSGYCLEIDDHYRSDLNQDYIILSVSEQGESGDHRSGGGAALYGNRFVGIPRELEASFRPLRRARQPQISGTQTAIVAGPAGEEIYTDEHGRVKVQFHWDRLGGNDENSSCWVRVSYAWAGDRWGAIHIPRIGQEVIVEFLEGDPDRPIVTGRVYNGDQKVPYELPANKTQSGVKSRSSKDGDAANFNEIRMEDKKGSEELYVHAEKDKNVVIKNNRTEEVGNDESIDIGNDRKETVGNDETISIGANRSEDVGKDETISIGGSRTESVGKNESITIGEDQEVSIGKSMTLTVGADASISVKKDLSESVGGKHDESVAKEYVLDAKKIQLTAKDEISLKVGKAKLLMKKNGDVTINGKKITIKGSGNVVIKGSKIAQN